MATLLGHNVEGITWISIILIQLASKDYYADWLLWIMFGQAMIYGLITETTYSKIYAGDYWRRPLEQPEEEHPSSLSVVTNDIQGMAMSLFLLPMVYHAISMPFYAILSVVTTSGPFILMWLRRPFVDGNRRWEIMILTLYGLVIFVFIEFFYSHHHHHDWPSMKEWILRIISDAFILLVCVWIGDRIVVMSLLFVATVSMIIQVNEFQKTAWFIMIWMIVGSVLFPILNMVLTMGEFVILRSLCAMVIVEWAWRVFSCTHPSSSSSSPPPPRPTSSEEIPDYALVALSGIVGCGLTIFAVSKTLRTAPVLLQLMLCMIGPLMVVEVALRYCSPHLTTTTIEASKDVLLLLPVVSPEALPHCLRWLFNFLTQSEHEIPRWYGLLYWIIGLLLLATPTMKLQATATVQTTTTTTATKATTTTASPSSASWIVVMRKWFHLVAIVLFGPITIMLPQLMSLSYAIALCGLALLEYFRPYVPPLQNFYYAFLDPTKDSSKTIVLSHILLVLGCALPLWMSQRLQQILLPPLQLQNQEGHNQTEIDSVYQTQNMLLLLSLWGVLCLGVGDSMGAIVGKVYGRTIWGPNRRTVEGSLAMASSMLLVGWMCWGWSNHHNAINERTYFIHGGLILATILTTIMEAQTWQMDNLVLPLVGSVILICFR